MASRRFADSRAETIEVSQAGQSMLENPLLNKSSACREEKRCEFGQGGPLWARVSIV